MQLKFIEYAGAQLILPAMFESYFPFDLDYRDIPTFCGPGGELWDRLVPDHIQGVWVAVCCMIHDWMFSVGKRTFRGFVTANLVLLWNLVALVFSQGEFSRLFAPIALLKCLAYWFAVMSRVGWGCFRPMDVQNPVFSPAFIDKLVRLKRRPGHD